MTKKDYIVFAKMFKELKKHEGHCEEGITEDVLKDLQNKLTIIFKEDNPSFNEAKFIEACGGLI